MTFLASHPIFAVLCFIAILVFIHETGHFLVGKWCGIGVEVYSIGFGPKVFGFTHKGTEYQLALLPLGGYVKFAGAISSEEVPERFQGMEMHKASLKARMATILAGPLANLLLAAVIFSVHGYQGIEHPAPIIGMVLPDTPAARAGLMSGDEVESIEGNPVIGWNDLREMISESASKPIDLIIKRNNTQKHINIKPDEIIAENMIGETVGQGRIGISFGLVPAIISTLSNNSIAGKAGIKVGDRVQSLTYSKPGEPESKHILSTWPQLLLQLENAFDSQANQIKLEVFEAALPGKKDENVKQETRDIVIDSTAWYASHEQIQDLGPVRKQLKLASILGLRDSQLTIAEGLEKLSETLLKGDRIISFQGEEVDDIYALSTILQKNTSQDVKLVVLRNDKEKELSISLNPIEVQKASGKETYYQLKATFWGQVEFPPNVTERYDNFMDATVFGFKETVSKSGRLVKAIFGLITGSVPLKSLGGPMLIAKIAGDAADAGWQVFFATMALISINLGVFNLFPIPALDGGQLVLLAAEGIKRKPLSEMAIENFQKIGFVMIMALIILATYNDLSRFWASMLKGMSGAFQ